MKIIAWHVKAKDREVKPDYIWLVPALSRYFREAFPQGVPVFSAVATGGKMSMGVVAGATFGPGGPGFVLLQILLLAVVGYMIDWIASATGHKQLGSMAKTVTLLSAFGIVVGSIAQALQKLWDFVG